MSRYKHFVGLFCALLVMGVVSTVAAEQEPEAAEVAEEDEEVEEQEVEEEDKEAGFRHASQLQIRATPLGLSLFSDTAYRNPVSFSDSESPLFDGTYLDAGITSALSPTFLWAGPYVEFLPIAVLELRASVQFMGYFGNFGYLYIPEDGQSWDDEALDRSWDQDLGQSGMGWMVTAQATPQILVGRVVATAETSYRQIGMDTEQAYYEPYFDLFFEARDTLFTTRPTVGYLFGSDPSVSHLVLGLRWEHARVSGTNLVRDTLGVVWNWKLPPSLMEWGDPAFAGYAGAFIEHPTRGSVSPYVGMQFMTSF